MKPPLALILFGLISITNAQDKPAPAVVPQTERPVPPAMPKPELRLVSPVGAIDARLKQLHETVGLTTEQQTQLKAVLLKNDQAMKTAVAAFRTSHTREDRQKLSGLMKAQDAEINAILTEAQKTKGQAAQNVIRSAQGFRPGSKGPSANRLSPGVGNIPPAPPPASKPPVTTK